MRITLPTQSRQLGPICIMQQIDVLELESRPTRSRVRPSCASPAGAPGCQISGRGDAAAHSVAFPNQALEAVFEKMVIIVPCKDEPVKTIQNILRGVPPDCAVILVSNCRDGYQAKARMLENTCRYGREAILVHQKFRGAAAAFDAVGVRELLDQTFPEKIRDGKGEGMYLGIAMARTFFPDREYVGFVDADNQVPGSVNEYCRVYAAGFILSNQYDDSGDEHVMVRVSWPSKPKVRDGEISFDEPEGRSSRVVNRFLDRLFAEPFGDGSKFITTGNAGEHAMTMDMALSSRWANGYAIETYQFMDPFLRAGSGSRETRASSLHTSQNSSSVASDDHASDTDSDTDSVVGSSGASIESASSYGDADCESRKYDGAFSMEIPAHAEYAAVGGGDCVGCEDEAVSEMDFLHRCPAVPSMKPVRILQIGTVNPHFHRQGDDVHILRMWAAGLGAIWHSLGPSTAIPGVGRDAIADLKSAMKAYALENGGIGEEDELPQPRVYPAMDHLDFDEFENVLMSKKYLHEHGAPRFFGLGNQVECSLMN